MRAVTEMMVSQTDHVLRVWATLLLKYSWTNQKPPSFTWEKMSEPAPVAITSNFGMHAFGVVRHNRRDDSPRPS